MKLREISGNAQRSPPPLSSPLARQIRGRNKRSINLCKTSFPASEHIVFLETKLEEVEKSQYSPNTGLPLKDKIKAQAAENSRLEEMLAELEHQFETRLRESVEHKTSVEVTLRRKIKQLEEEIASKDCAIQDLEHKNDSSQRDLSNAQAYKAAVERLEFEKCRLEETNRSLEKRNDVLTNLLGHSPTRSHHGFELPSPVREHQQKTPRPRSMMPRIPSSPTHIATNRPISLHASPSPFQHDYFSPFTALTREQDHPCNRRDPRKAGDDSQSVDSGLGESCSIRSGNESTSKRSSMHSNASASPAAWGLPLPPSPTEASKERSSRKRMTRRFASGSTQLKPLVLPTLNATNGVPQSAPLPTAYSNVGRRNFSEQSIDPTISFLSHSYDTPTQPRRRSNTWASADALQALEGSSEVHFVSFEEVPADQNASQSIRDPAPAFQDLRTYPQYHPAPAQFSPTLVDDMIVEEDSTAFLSNQFEDAGDQSFQSMVGELSVTDSDIESASDKGQLLTTQFLESDLRRPTSVQLLSFAGSRIPSEEPMRRAVAHANHDDDEALEHPIFGPSIPMQYGFANPLTSPYALPDASLQHPAETCAYNKFNNPGGQDFAPPQSSSIAFPYERPMQIKRHSTGIGLQTAEMIMPNPLKAAPSLSGRRRPQRPQSPFELLQRKGSPKVSLTSVTNRTAFGTISRYTSYVREIKRNPTALARRVIANAWCNNWKRLGRLSWWVLGLFLGRGWKQQVEKRQGWEVYDGERIAQAEHERLNGPGPSRSQDTTQKAPSKPKSPRHSTKTQQKKVKFDGAGASLSQHNEIPGVQNVNNCKSCEQRNETSWGRSLYLWGKFSVAIMLAVGGAVANGPEEMLKDCDLHNDAASENRAAETYYTPNPSEADQDILFDYPMELHDDDNDDDFEVDDDTLSESFRAARSIACSTSSHQKELSIPRPPTDIYSTFGAPSTDEYDCYDDNGQSRPGRSRTHPMTQRLDLRTSGLRVASSADLPDLGTLQWMQNLSVNDFERFRDVDDADRTIRAIPRKAGKSTHPTLG
jgi:hypothetical protein